MNTSFLGFYRSQLWGAMFRASTIAPRTELFIKFACDELRPEYRVDANVVQWDTTRKSAQVDIPMTFVQRNTAVKTMLLHPDKRCSQDPEVHRAAAKLSAAITSAQGILSTITLGWWAQVCISPFELQNNAF